MSKRLNAENLGNQSQKKVKLTLQDIEENSIDQLIAQPSPAFKETLKKMLAANNEEIARLANLNKKILECLEKIDQQDQKNGIGAGVVQQSASKVSLIFLNCFLFHISFFLGAILLVRIAGESLASSLEESVSERFEQRALGLQKLAPNRQLARQSKS
jgi:hypothetical protein